MNSSQVNRKHGKSVCFLIGNVPGKEQEGGMYSQTAGKGPERKGKESR